jgi:flagellum-specific peptidoglycan hydrolase FlgJ
MGLEQYKYDFINLIAPLAVEEMMRTVLLGKPVLASIKIAQGCLESGYGKSVPNGNYFGVKGSGSAYETLEFINGKWVTVKASFETYGSLEASVIGQSQFLIENGRYTRYGYFDACEERDWKRAAQCLENATYATDPKYAELLISIVERFDLSKYDKEADTMLQEIKNMQGQINTLLLTAEAHIEQINELKAKLSDQDAPKWSKDEFGDKALDGIMDTQKGPPILWRLLALALRIKKK